MLFTITPYMFMFCFSINTPVCCMYFASSNINLATYFSLNSLSSSLSFFSARFRTLLLRPDLQNSRHPAREQRNLQVEASASHDFGPDISVWTPSLTLSNRSVSFSFFIHLLTIIFIGQGVGFASKSWWPTDSNWQKNIQHTCWTEKADHFFTTRLEKLQAGTAEPLNFEQWCQHISALSSIRRINGFISSAYKYFVKAHLST